MEKDTTDMMTIRIDGKSIDDILRDAHLQGLSIGVRPSIRISHGGMAADNKALRRDAKRIGHDFKKAIRKTTA